MVIESAELKQSLLEQMVGGNFSEAEMLEKDHSVSAIEVIGIAEKAFLELMKTKKYNLAYKLGENYGLPSELRIEAVNSQFRLYIANKEFDKAVEWGRKYKIPESEIINAGVKAFNEALDSRDVVKAIEFKNNFKIPFDLIASQARRWFNIYFENQSYPKALILGTEFDISRKRTLTAGLRAYFVLLGENKINEFARLEENYSIISDRDLSQVDKFEFKNFSKVFIENVVKDLISREKVDQLATLIETLKLIENRDFSAYIGSLMKETIAEVAFLHNNILTSGNYNSAFRIVENFRLLSNIVPADIKVRIIETAEKLHHNFMQQDNLLAARTVKDNYKLFNENIITNSIETVTNVSSEFLKNSILRGKIDEVKTVIEEYQLKGEKLNEIVSTSLIKQLKSRKFLEAFEIVEELNVRVSSADIKAEAKASFNEAYENGQMELSTNIALHFKLREKRVVNAAFIIWQKQMESGKYEDAVDLRKKMRIPKTKTQEVAKDAYNMLISQGRSVQAVQLRKDYSLNLSIWEIVVELMKKVFTN